MNRGHCSVDVHSSARPGMLCQPCQEPIDGGFSLTWLVDIVEEDHHGIDITPGIGYKTGKTHYIA